MCDDGFFLVGFVCSCCLMPFALLCNNEDPDDDALLFIMKEYVLAFRGNMNMKEA